MNMRGFFIKTRRRRWIFLRLLPALSIFAFIFFLLRGPYLSNSIKRVIIPALENATGERIITDHAVINLFPFYLQVKSIRVLDKDGNRLIWVTKTRAYIDLLALLHGEIRVRRLTLKEPNIIASKRDLQRIAGHIKRYLSNGGGKRFAFTLRGIKIAQGEFDLRDMGRFGRLSGRGFVASGIIKGDGLVIDWSLKEGNLLLNGLPEMVYGADGRVEVKRDGEIKISNVDLDFSGSVLRADGNLNFTPAGAFQGGMLDVNAKIFVETVNRLLGMSGSQGKDLGDIRKGELKFSGSVEIKPDRGKGWPLIVDLKTSGFFYLEDLMRLLKVKDTITGKLLLEGRIKGSYPDLTGQGRVRLENALFDTLPINDAEGKIKYRDRRFDLKDFIAHTYNGELKGDAYLLIPHGDYFVRASVNSIDSKGFFGFVKWKAPFSKGIINGEFDLKKIKGKDFDVVADVKYMNEDISEDSPVSRLKGIEGKIHLRDKIVNIRDARFFTSTSEMFMNGRIDLVKKGLALDLKLNTNDASELMQDFKGNLSLSCRASGAFDRIEILGSLQMSSGSISDFAFDRLDSNLVYTINSLKLKILNINKGRSDYSIKGVILFKDAERLFSFNNPLYDIKVSMRDGDVRTLIKTFYGDVHVSGDVDGILLFKGTKDRYKGKGKLHVKNAGILGQDFDSVDLEASFSEEMVGFQSLKLKVGASEFSGKGTINPNDGFKLSLKSNRLSLEDIKIFSEYNIKAMASDLRLNASGTFENPDVDFSMNLQDVHLKMLTLHNGMIKGDMKDRTVHFNTSLMNNRMSVDGAVTIEREPEWNLNVHFKKGDYKTLLKGFIEDIPEDLYLKLKGDVRASGSGKRVLSMVSRFDTVNLALYGYRLVNKEDVLIRLDDRRLEIKSFELTGNKADISISGRVDIRNDYDIRMKGYLSLAPLRILTNRISSLRGDSSFTIDISGRWKSPVIMGEIDLNGVTTSIKGLPYIIGPFNGNIYIKGDRMIIKSLVGEMAGGRIEMSGVGYLDGLLLKRLSITSRFNEISMSHLEGIRAVFDGQLFYDASEDGSVLTGDLYISKARYKRRVEWKRWLLGPRETGREAFQGPAFLKDTALNIHISGSKDIMVDNNILRTPVRVDLTITGRLSRYGLIGSVRIDEGSIYFRDNEFEIISARVDFIEADEVRPFFDIKAETFTSGYRIKLSLVGPVDKLDLSLFSDPPLPENDILTLLTAGRIGKEGMGFESGIAATEATAILTGGVQEVFEESVKGIVGIERFEINPQTTSTGAISPRITVGKRLLDERLSVSYTTSIGTTEESIIKLKYRIGKKISVIGTRDELGSIGVDLNYRFEFE
jgi:translocation and assembly module TamB